MKTCTRCNKTKPLDQFTKRAASKSGYTAACKECKNLGNRVSYLLNPEPAIKRAHERMKTLRQDKIFKRAWKQWCKAKRLKRIPPWISFTKDMLPKYYELFEGVDPDTMTVDHIIPFNGYYVSGLHVPSNLQLLTQSENSKKSNNFFAYKPK